MLKNYYIAFLPDGILALCMLSCLLCQLQGLLQFACSLIHQCQIFLKFKACFSCFLSQQLSWYFLTFSCFLCCKHPYNWLVWFLAFIRLCVHEFCSVNSLVSTILAITLFALLLSLLHILFQFACLVSWFLTCLLPCLILPCFLVILVITFLQFPCLLSQLHANVHLASLLSYLLVFLHFCCFHSYIKSTSLHYLLLCYSKHSCYFLACLAASLSCSFLASACLFSYFLDCKDSTVCKLVLIQSYKLPFSPFVFVLPCFLSSKHSCDMFGRFPILLLVHITAINFPPFSVAHIVANCLHPFLHA